MDNLDSCKGIDFMEKNFEALDLDPVTTKKKLNIPLLIVSLVWFALSILSPFAVMSRIVCVIYIIVPVAIIVYSIIKRKVNKIAVIIICNLISIVFNSLILFTHFSNILITETAL